ncbi:hypothetical protein RJ640_002094 [Escallonia rubra]|uniref:Uncharacterized protein n=1 Tax=Escallonia rubra TaxID=112253 RepID=A0AA88R135_9ASTE|nr:hypothetical protein RJ640_002094 [Escallonia rubra]
MELVRASFTGMSNLQTSFKAMLLGHSCQTLDLPCGCLPCIK